MKRLIIAGTIAFLIVIILSTMFTQDSLLQAFASNDIALQVIRIGMIGLLVSLLVIAQPRSHYLRVVLGGAATFLVFGAGNLLSHYIIGMLDALLFIEVAIIFAMEAIEVPETEKAVEEKTSKVRRSKTTEVNA